LLAAYVIWLIVRRDQGFSVAVDGWGVDGLEIVASSLCLARAFAGPKSRNGGAVALILGASLLAWTLGDVATTIESSQGRTPPVPSVADLFYLSFYPLAYVAVVLYLRAEVRGLSRSSWLDGLVAGLGAASVCATYAFHGILSATGGDKLALATDLAYPVGDLLLLALIAAGTNFLPRGRRGPWAMIATGMGLNVLGDTFNLLGPAIGSSRIGAVLNSAAWPAAILLMSMAVWVRPPAPVTTNPSHRAGFLLPGVASTAALLILFIGTMRHPGATAIGLATATLVVVGVRLALTLWDLQALTEQRRRQAVTDELTGLGNRRHLFQVMADFFGESDGPANRSEHPKMAFLFMDLNHFKEVNDSFGHPAGDMLLKILGERFRASLRAVDTPVRLGGDEFAVILMDADAAQASEVAQRLLDCLYEPFEIGALRVTVGASVGIALAPGDATRSTDLFWCADVAMYRAKLAGTSFAFYDPVLDNDGHQWKLLADLRKGLDEGQLVLHYQPQLDVHSGCIHAVEALVRWAHPKHGLIPPLKFIPLAEEAGLMGRLTGWVLDEALRQCADWRSSGHEVTVAVNISATNLLSKGFSELVSDGLARHGLAPGALVLEITETTVISDFDGSKAVIDELLGIGVDVSIDDFGAGVTSLAHLSALAVRELKLDRVFIGTLAEGTRDRELQLVRSTVELGHALGLRVVAEGIEDIATLQLVSKLGCDVAQGYYISKPKPAAELDFAAASALALTG
jgi:diguanylate cyclase (GGDEF)-like protein